MTRHFGPRTLRLLLPLRNAVSASLLHRKAILSPFVIVFRGAILWDYVNIPFVIYLLPTDFNIYLCFLPELNITKTVAKC